MGWGWGTPPLDKIRLKLTMFKFRRKWVTEATFWIKLFKLWKRQMRARKENEINKVLKKGRRERRKLTRRHRKWLWEREKHKPGSEADRERESWASGTLGFLTLGYCLLWEDGWLSGAGGSSGILWRVTYMPEKHFERPR